MISDILVGGAQVPVVLVGAIVACIVLYFLGRALEPKAYPDEPPWARPAIPFIGHILGFLWAGNGYLVGLMGKEGIRTINFGWKRSYVISSLDMSLAVERQSTAVSFTPVIKMMAESLSHLEAHSLPVFDANPHRNGLEAGLGTDTLKEYHRAFGPGAGSEEIQVNMLNQILETMAEADHGEIRELYSWLSHIISQASMRAVYGPKHPFRDPKVEKAFWDFKMSCGPLLMNFASGIVARKAIISRDIMDKAFGEYYATGAINEGSELAWARYTPPANYGVGSRDIARLESPFLFAVLATSPPACFWALLEIHRIPGLLHEVRNELAGAIVFGETNKGDEAPTVTVQIEHLKKHCPLILSIFQETLRRLSIWSLFRLVEHDTTLANRYFLKAGTLVLLPNHLIHNSSEVWGPTAMDFDPYRFMPDREKHPSTHFRTFGAAPNRCPGRHFATNEIISILCLLVMRFDLVPQSRRGWDLPAPYLAVFGAIMPPSKDVNVKLQPREGWQGKWSFELGDPLAKFPLVADRR